MGASYLQPPALSPLTITKLRSCISSPHDFKAALRDQLGDGKITTYQTPTIAIYRLLCHLREQADGDAEEVILPRYCCEIFLDAIEAAGLKPQFCDVDPETLQIRLESLEDTAPATAVAILPVSVFGLMNEMDAIRAFATEHEIPLIEDVMYALGASYNGDPAGSFGDAVLCSFAPGKAVPVGGGAVLTRESVSPLPPSPRETSTPPLAQLAGLVGVRGPRTYGLLHTLLTAANLSILSDFHPGEIEISETAVLEQMSGVQQRLAVGYLSTLAADQERRNRVADAYQHGLAPLAGVRTVNVPSTVTPHFIRYPVFITDSSRRDDIATALQNRGVTAEPMYLSNVDSTEYPGAATIVNQILTLPTHPAMTEKDYQRVVETIRTI